MLPSDGITSGCGCSLSRSPFYLNCRIVELTMLLALGMTFKREERINRSVQQRQRQRQRQSRMTAINHCTNASLLRNHVAMREQVAAESPGRRPKGSVARQHCIVFVFVFKIQK